MYLLGFGNYHQSEAVKGALPTNQNSPQNCNFGLYAEQLSGTAFTRPRQSNLHSWLYRKLPTAAQGPYRLYNKKIIQAYAEDQSPNPLRWLPIENPKNKDVHFLDGLFHVAGNDKVQTFIYQATRSMDSTYFADHDGELLFIPYEGTSQLCTEFGVLNLNPGMVAVIPRGIYFKMQLISTRVRGYLCENAGSPLTLPQLGFIGANGLANPRHFNYPLAAFEEASKEATILCKYQTKLWKREHAHSPLNVVAWHGNYAPYSYDLNLFNTINTVSFDHPDPSIFTVLTSESDTLGVADLDFVIFPARWMVAEHTFRLPYFHRNIMSEFMGLIEGEYDAKQEGFLPGGLSIHNCMTAHGPDATSYVQHAGSNLKPEKYDNTLAFMLETRAIWQVTEKALKHPSLQKDYVDCWKGFQVGK